jgi:hypothetical protein
VEIILEFFGGVRNVNCRDNTEELSGSWDMTVVLADEEINFFRLTDFQGVRLVSEGTDWYRVFSPFMFPDGDHVVLVLKREESGWVLSDERHTMMHLSYRMKDQDPHSEKRKEIINSILA